MPPACLETLLKSHNVPSEVRGLVKTAGFSEALHFQATWTVEQLDRFMRKAAFDKPPDTLKTSDEKAFYEQEMAQERPLPFG